MKIGPWRVLGVAIALITAIAFYGGLGLALKSGLSAYHAPLEILGRTR